MRLTKENKKSGPKPLKTRKSEIIMQVRNSSSPPFLTYPPSPLPLLFTTQSFALVPISALFLFTARFKGTASGSQTGGHRVLVTRKIRHVTWLCLRLIIADRCGVLLCPRCLSRGYIIVDSLRPSSSTAWLAAHSEHDHLAVHVPSARCCSFNPPKSLVEVGFSPSDPSTVHIIGPSN